MPIVKYKNQSGVTYAYEQTSSYDPVKKQSRPVRKYLGRVDPETGEIIATTGKRGRPPKRTAESQGCPDAQQDLQAMYDRKCRDLESVSARLSAAMDEIDSLKARVRESDQLLSSIMNRISSFLE